MTVLAFDEVSDTSHVLQVAESPMLKIRRQDRGLLRLLPRGWTVRQRVVRKVPAGEFGLDRFRFITGLDTHLERFADGEEAIRGMLSSGARPCDESVLLAFWRNKSLIPREWKKRTDGCITRIFFDGVVVGPSRHEQYTPCLLWREPVDALLHAKQGDWEVDFHNMIYARHRQDRSLGFIP